MEDALERYRKAEMQYDISARVYPDLEEEKKIHYWHLHKIVKYRTTITKLATVKVLCSARVKMYKDMLDYPVSNLDWVTEMNERFYNDYKSLHSLLSSMTKNYPKNDVPKVQTFHILDWIEIESILKDHVGSIDSEILLKSFIYDNDQDYFRNFRSLCKRRKIKIPSKLLSLTRKRS